MLAPLLLVLVFAAGARSADSSRSEAPPSRSEAPPVDTLDTRGMQQLVMANDKAVILMHSTGCARAAEFAPTLATIAQAVPGLAFGQVALTADDSAAKAHGILAGAPALKAFFRNAPPPRRMLEYRGPPSFEAVLEWARAVDAWDGGDGAPPGWEVGTHDEDSTKGGKEEL